MKWLLLKEKEPGSHEVVINLDHVSMMKIGMDEERLRIWFYGDTEPIVFKLPYEEAVRAIEKFEEAD
jgi:hypothetical protein